MASIEKSPRVDMAKLEVEATSGAPRIKGAPSVPAEPMPHSVEHLEGGTRLTAEAVMRDYESAAKEIKAMGAELISAAKKCEAMTADLRNTIRDTAEAYRQQGKKIFGRIEECALLTEDVRKTCEDVKRRMIERNGDVQ